MASKTGATTLSLFAIATALLVLSLVSVATSSGNHSKMSPFEFLNHLKGCHKGDKVKGVKELKKYLERFGYLHGDPDNDDFDDLVESAIKTYQLNFNLNATGTLDPKRWEPICAFDGEGGTLAHAFSPTIGMLHFDADEKWAVGAVEGKYDIETVALHEIGHLLGLGHSSVEGAVMFPTAKPGFAQGLHRDDARGIKALYNHP